MKKALHRMWKDRILYLILAPTILYFVVFRVWPMINMRPAFGDILKNTLIISFMKYVLLFPFFVIFAIVLNELRLKRFRQYVQVVSYLPHFLSWVVIAGIWMSFLGPSPTDALNEILGWFGVAPVSLLTSKGAIRWVLFLCEGWRSLGWDSIIFFTTILNISPDIYEAAKMDGASRPSIIRYIILPALVIPMTTVFILNLGFFMSAGFDQVYNFTNNAVNSVIDILDTYINRVGIENAQYSIGTAVSLIKGVVGVVLVLMTHVTSKKLTGEGVW